MLLLIGYLIATGLLRHPAGQTPVEVVNAVLFWPLLVIQLILSVAGADEHLELRQRRNAPAKLG